MKKLLLIIVFLLSCVGFSQTYTVNTILDVSPRGSYHPCCRNAIEVVLYYTVDGEESSIMLSGGIIDLSSSRGRATLSESFDVTGENFEITRVVTRSSQNDADETAFGIKLGGCSGHNINDRRNGIYTTLRERSINTRFSRTVRDITLSWLTNLTINITPNIDISFPNGGETSIGCVSEGIEIQTNSNGSRTAFSNPRNIYNWQYHDNITPRRRVNREYVNNLNEVLRYYEELLICYDEHAIIAFEEPDDEDTFQEMRQNLTQAIFEYEESSRDPDEFVALGEHLWRSYRDYFAFPENRVFNFVYFVDPTDDPFAGTTPCDDLNNNRPFGPLGILTNFRADRRAEDFTIWRAIPSKIGQKDISLSITDLSLYEEIGFELLNKPIDIRVRTTHGNNTGDGYNVQYLPEPPSISNPPQINQPTCNYSNDASFTVQFDRPIFDTEQLDIAIDRLAQGQTVMENPDEPLYLLANNPLRTTINNRYAIQVANDPAITIDNPNYNAEQNTYHWNRPIGAGQYVMRIAGFERDNRGGSLQCREYFYFFEIAAPEQVSFSATSVNQRCFDTNDGAIQIIASGGSGVYEYILNGNNWSSSQNFTLAQSPFTVGNLPPGTYNVQVRDSNGCLDRVNETDQPKVERLTIEAKQDITHTINQNTNNPRHAGAPGTRDGEITITSLAGGTPNEDRQGQYFDYQVLLNGTTPSGISGRAYLTNGFRLLGLPAGAHSIRYTDANSCVRTLGLPTINNPAPITYTLQQSPPSCADASDGELRITNLRGGYPSYTIEWRRNGVLLPNTSQILTTGVGTYSLSITDERSGLASQNNIVFNNVPAPITFTEQVRGITCFGGTARVELRAQGGVPPYEYGYTSGGITTWTSSNILNLPASFGGYRFQVRQLNNTDCSAEPSNLYRITEPEEFFIDDVEVTNNTIYQDNNGAITLTVIGRTAPYHVTWVKQDDASFSATGLSILNLRSGFYIPTITDNTGICTIQGAPIFVDEPDELIVTVDENSNRILCIGETGGLIASATGGSETYTYTWYIEGRRIANGGEAILSNLTEGTYTVEVNDGFTTARTTGTLIEPELLTLDVTGTNVSCYNGENGAITLQPTGGVPPYVFSIDNRQTYTALASIENNNIEQLRAGAYSVWLRDSNGCELNVPQNITLTQPDEITIAETLLEDVKTLGGNDGAIATFVSGGVGTYAVLWTREGDNTFTANTLEISDLLEGVYTISITDENNCVAERTFTVRQPLPLEVELTMEIPVLCHNAATGLLQATVTGGYPIESTPSDFEYRWFNITNGTAVALNTDVTLNALEGLQAGIYRIEVNDSQGANTSTQFEIRQPDDLVATLDGEVTDVLCFGEATGRIAISVTGGPIDPSTGNYLPYSYSWTKQEDNSFTANTRVIENLQAGLYTVEVTDANACTVALNAIEVDQPEAALNFASVTFENLSGYQTENGSITVIVEGGTAPYNYQWTKQDDTNFVRTVNAIDSLTIGTYLLTVTDAHGCTITLEQELTQPDELLVNIRPLTLEESVQCHGGVTEQPLETETLGGVPPYNYQWTRQSTPNEVLYSTANTPLVSAGVYQLQVIDANRNQATVSYTVAEPSALQLNANVTDLLCNNDADGRIDITVNGGVLPYTYQWSNGENTEDVSGLRAGSYNIRVQDANGCVLEDVITVMQPRALAVTVDRVFPSALGLSDGFITLNVFGGTEPYQYEWRDSSGRAVANTQSILNDTGIEKYAATITDANNCTVVIDDVDLFEPPVLEAFIDQISVISCSGNTETGQLTAVVQGGIPFNATKQYNYAWFNANTNTPVGTDAITVTLGAGNYYVDVTDVLGTTTRSTVFTLVQPEPLDVQLAADFINCGDANDWTIIPSVSGGTAPYQYSWQTGQRTASLEDITSGTYTLEVTDQRGCTATATITTTPPPTLLASLEPVHPVCYNSCDGAVILSAQGGTPPYTYAWNTGATTQDITNRCAGIYTVSITDAKGCRIERETTLINPEQRIIDLGDDVTLCKDQTLLLDASISDANASYQWTSDNGFTANTPSIEVSTTGNYTVTVTDNKGCIAADTIFVEAITKTIITDFIGSSQVFVGERVLLFDISDPLPDNLLWEFSQGAEIHHQDNDFAEVSFDSPGTYTVSMHATFGLCEETRTKTIIVVERTFVAEGGEDGTTTANGIDANIDLKTYPNPTPNGIFTMEINLPKVEDISVKIYGIGSNIPIDVKSVSGTDYYKLEYNLQRIPSGLYFILFETASGDQVHKLVIQ